MSPPDDDAVGMFNGLRPDVAVQRAGVVGTWRLRHGELPNRQSPKCWSWTLNDKTLIVVGSP